MKVGFGGAKKKHNKQKKKGGKKGKGGDDMMQDAPEVEQQQQQQAAEADMVDGQGQQLSAKEKKRQRMVLKQTLKVKVAGLKAHRNKLTKLAGNKDARRSLNKEMRSLVKEQLGITNSSAKQQAKAGGEGMAE